LRIWTPLPDFVGSSTEVATTFTTGSSGEIAGAVYVVAPPLVVLVGLMVPQMGEHATPSCSKLHVTPLLVPSSVTVAVTCFVLLKGTVVGLGDTEIEIGRIVISALASLLATICNLPSCAPCGNIFGVGGAV
jgi:hypothetical protein